MAPCLCKYCFSVGNFSLQVHALGRGARGQDGDLERSRRQLLSSGHVLRGNFDPARDAADADFNEDNFEAIRDKCATVLDFTLLS